MTEKDNKQEVLTEKLGEVTGGSGVLFERPCPKCGGEMKSNAVPFGPFTRYTCVKCGYFEDE